MRRFALWVAAVFAVAGSNGCCGMFLPPHMCAPCGAMGCGGWYLGDWLEDPARCDPCDRCGNWTGQACGCGSHHGWGYSMHGHPAYADEGPWSEEPYYTDSDGSGQYEDYDPGVAREPRRYGQPTLAEPLSASRPKQAAPRYLRR